MRYVMAVIALLVPGVLRAQFGVKYFETQTCTFWEAVGYCGLMDGFITFDDPPL